MRLLTLMLCVLFVVNKSSGINRFHNSTIYIAPFARKQYKYTQRLTYERKPVINVRISSYYDTSANDSLHLYDSGGFENIRIRIVVHYLDLSFSKALSTHRIYGGFFDIIRKSGLVTMQRYSSYKIEEDATEQGSYNGLPGMNRQFKAEEKMKIPLRQLSKTIKTIKNNRIQLKAQLQ